MKINKQDIVRIMSPNFFIRCGYELSFQDAIDHVTKAFGPEITALQNKVSGKNNLFVSENIIKELAKIYIRNYDYKSKERKIYTKEILKFKEYDFEVQDTRVVKTGVYNSGGVTYSYEGEPDYHPAYLTKQKNHTILSLSLVDITNSVYHSDYKLEIEDINVKLVGKKENNKIYIYEPEKMIDLQGKELTLEDLMNSFK